MADAQIWMILEIAFGIAGLLGNALVLFVFFRTKSLRSLINLFIINQSLIDFTTSVVFLVLHVSPPISLDSNSTFHQIFCAVWLSEYTLWALLIGSSMNLSCITLDRYFAVVFPIKYRKTAGRKGTILAVTVAFTWTGGFIFDCYWAFIQEITPDGYCIPVWKSKVLQGVIGFFIFIVTYLGPLGIMVYSYLCILWKLRVQTRLISEQNDRDDQMATVSGRNRVTQFASDNGGNLNHSDQNQVATKKSKRMNHAKHSVLKTMLSVSLVYAICWAPIAFSYLSYNFGGYLDFTSTFYLITKLFVDSNMAVNPFIYTFQYRQFQEALARVFGIKCGWGIRVTPSTTRGNPDAS
ncbi:Orexin receptor type 2 [Holothuria leucospilota]|uniref:Orexin receptor type 2 n=1 Tax=Holothuria leucospilota TaxID=206669 RepID=A0A9Q1H0Z8_HOLLE|nr:Orexin receptor type 2 [Holothuria leucospilota]